MLRMYRNRKTEGRCDMKWLDRLVDKCIERKPNKRIRAKAELLKLLEEAEREQLKGIFRRNGYDEV